ncbi:hypothetical protein JOM56_004735 [Amanita muscaria]
MLLNIHNSLISRCLHLLHIIRIGCFYNRCCLHHLSRARFTRMMIMIPNGMDNSILILWLGHFHNWLLNQTIILISLHQSQPAYYSHSQPPQQQQQQRWYHTLLQCLMARDQRFDSPDLNRQGQKHAPQPQFQRGRNRIPTSAEPGPGAAPAATQFQGAQVNMSGNPRFANIGTNMGNLTTVNNYGGTHGLEKLEKFVSFAALHDSAEQDPDRRCHPGTRKTVLTRLQHWFNNPNATDRIIWLHGPAGAGKSAIAQTIADEYKKRGVAATFFFYRSDPRRNDGNRLFPTIAWQLAFSIPPTKDFIVHALDETPHLPTQAVEPQFEQLVAHPFQPTNNVATQMSHGAPVVITDGVDECSDEKLQRRFLGVIGNAVKNDHVPLRFLLVSRPEALIEETLNKFKDCTVSIDLAKLGDSNRDIKKYLEDKFSEIASNRGLDPTWPGQEIIEEIVSKSSGNFIFASVVVRFISDEDYDPEFLLNIVRNLTPRGNMSPFALLDELFLEILKRQRDQEFLKTFLALLIGRSSIKEDDLHRDDAMLMNVAEKDLFHRYPSRSGQYHVTKRGGLKRYLELVVDSVVRQVSMATGQPNLPVFKSIVRHYPPGIVLPVEDWQDALKPLLDLQDKILKTSKFQLCCVTQVMRELLLHLDTDSVMVVDKAISDRMSSVLAFDYAETGKSPDRLKN